MWFHDMPEGSSVTCPWDVEEICLEGDARDADGMDGEDLLACRVKKKALPPGRLRARLCLGVARVFWLGLAFSDARGSPE